MLPYFLIFSEHEEVDLESFLIHFHNSCLLDSKSLVENLGSLLSGLKCPLTAFIGSRSALLFPSFPHSPCDLVI